MGKKEKNEKQKKRIAFLRPLLIQRARRRGQMKRQDKDGKEENAGQGGARWRVASAGGGVVSYVLKQFKIILKHFKTTKN